jgi:optic atrophy protein 1
MPSSTRDDILQLCEKHMNNPNALILCVLDGATDAERSLAAEAVRKADPKVWVVAVCL